MRPVVLILLITLIIAPMSHGLLFENLAHKNLYSTPGEFKSIGHFRDGALVSSQKLWAVWNHSIMEIYQNTSLIKKISGPISKAWIGDAYVVIYTGKATQIIGINNEKKFLVSANPTSVKIGGLYVVLSTANYFAVVDLHSGKVYHVAGYPKFYPSSTNVYFVNGSTLSAWNKKFLWSKNISADISDLSFCTNGIYVLTPKFTDVVSENGKFISRLHVYGDRIMPYRNYIATYSRFLSDDEGKVWGLHVFWANGTLMNSFSVYMEPHGFMSSGNMLAYYTAKMLHINKNGMDFVANNTFKSVAITRYAIIGWSDGKIYELSLSTIKFHLVGHDNDLDWIPDSTDPDDDNDGMPDWWEIQNGLNPDNPADRNQDPDHDGLTNYQEYLNGTDPHNWDTDGDGYSDGYEVANGMNPLIPNFTLKANMDNISIIFIVLFALLFIMGKNKKD